MKALLAKADGAFALGRMDILQQLCKQIEALVPGHADALHYQGVVALQSGDAERAVVLISKAIERMPGCYAFHMNLAAALLLRGEAAKALVVYKQTAALMTRGDVSVQLGCADCYMSLEQPQQAMHILKRLLVKLPADISLNMRCFRACYAAAAMDGAKYCLLQVLVVEPDHAEAHYGLALLAVAAGQFEETEHEVCVVLAHAPGHVDAYKLLADVHLFSEGDAHLAAMLALCEQLSGSERATLVFALGKVFHDLKQYDRAFTYYNEANGLRREALAYEHGHELARMRNITRLAAGRWLGKTCGFEGGRPIFIVGMPRCGSTLVEQILAAHPDVESRGECNVFQLSAESLDMQSILPAGEADQQLWYELGLLYMQRLDCDVGRVVDKTLTNIHSLGAIHRALPHACIIHVRRNPLDTCLSIYRNDLQGQGFQYAFQLQELAEYYMSYTLLMQYWREALPAGVIYELDYEQLVGKPEHEVGKLLQACDLPWDEQCLQFHKRNSRVLTASAVQVRGAINTSSVAGWKHYERHLQPLLDILEPETIQHTPGVRL